MATSLPGLGSVPHSVVIPYFVFVPGFALLGAFSRRPPALEAAFYSIVFSLAISAGVYALESLYSGVSSFPLETSVPAATLALAAYAYYHGRGAK